MKFLGLGDFLKILIDQLTDLVFIIDPEDLTLLEVNDAACQVLGYSCDSLRGMKLVHIDQEIEDFAELSQTRSMLIERQEIHYESKLIRKDGATFPVEVKAKLVESEGKSYICAVARDLTVRKKQEDALIERNRVLEEFKRITIGRELKMIELKQEINRLRNIDQNHASR